MKPTRIISLFCLTLLLTLAFNTSTYAQDKTDTITTLDGQKKEGKVIGIGTDSIKFIYSGETLEYNIKKSDINKIDYSSGRTEVFNKIISEADINKSLVNNRHKIAVLPFECISNDQGIMIDAMSHKAQEDCINSIKENTVGDLTVQEAITTNSLLAKHNVSQKKLREITPSEMAKILGVEYVLYGTVNITNKGTISSGSDVSTYRNKNRGSRGHRKSSGVEISSGVNSTRTNYDSKINLSILNYQGKSLYSDSKRAFGSGVDAYNSSLNYLIKRTPFGKKAKH